MKTIRSSLAVALLLTLLMACGGPVTTPEPPEPPGPPEPGGFEAAAVDVGDSFSVALSSDGTVYTWGSNASGQLGNGAPANANATRPVTVSTLENISSIAAGSRHTLALDEDGQVWAWGHNNRGQIGVGWPGAEFETHQYHRPVNAGLENIVAVAASGEASYALDADGVVWAWGNNSRMELGDGSTVSRGLPEAVAFPEDIAIASLFAGFGRVHAIDTAGEVWYWGDAAYRHGNGDAAAVPAPARAAEFSELDMLDLVDYAGSDSHVLAIDSEGRLYGWGNNSDGELARPSDVFVVPEPTAIAGAPESVTSIAAGGGVSIAVSGGSVYTWGTSHFGELGDGTTGGTVRREPQVLTGLSDVVSVAVGALSNDSFGRHVLALTASGEVYSWGYNSTGQLGTGGEADSAVPQQVLFED